MAVFISQRLTLQLSAEVLPDLPRACFENLLRYGVLTSSGESSEFINNYPENVIDGNTFDYWQPDDGNGWLQVVLPSAEDVDFLGIAAHNIGSLGASVVLQYWDGSTWIDCHDAITPVNDDVLMVFFDTIFSNTFRVLFSGGAPIIGVVYVGRAFAFQRKIYGGHSPVTLARTQKVTKNISEAGLDLGRSMIREGAATSIAFNNLTAPWVRSFLKPVIELMKTQPFFFAWRPDSYPSEVGYVWTDEDIKPTNQGTKNYMSLSFNVKGFINGTYGLSNFGGGVGDED